TAMGVRVPLLALRRKPSRKPKQPSGAHEGDSALRVPYVSRIPDRHAPSLDGEGYRALNELDACFRDEAGCITPMDEGALVLEVAQCGPKMTVVLHTHPLEEIVYRSALLLTASVQNDQDSVYRGELGVEDLWKTIEVLDDRNASLDQEIDH